jgi:4-hydroxy-tetrahydrodipicolinate synthase
MTKNGVEVVLEAGRTVWKNNPEILQPVADFFGVNVEERLFDNSLLKPVMYEGY